jgi:hypothetical protein
VTWKQFAVLCAVLFLLSLVRVVGGEVARWIALGVILALAYVGAHVSTQRWKRRVEKLKGATPAEREAALAEVPEDDRAAARIALGMVSADDATVDPTKGEEFGYPRTPAVLREGIFWGSVLMAAIPAVLLALDRVPEGERIYAVLLMLGFSLSVGAQLKYGDWELTRIRLTPSGLQQINPDGSRVGILWSEVTFIRLHRWRGSLEIRGRRANQRIWVSYKLERFPRFLELVTAYAELLEERLGE